MPVTTAAWFHEQLEWPLTRYELCRIQTALSLAAIHYRTEGFNNLADDAVTLRDRIKQDLDNLDESNEPEADAQAQYEEYCDELANKADDERNYWAGHEAEECA